MKLGPRYKICRRLGAPIFEKCQSQRYVLSENKKTPKQSRGFSEYGRQLIEKQKARLAYGLSEKQFAAYVKNATQYGGANPIGTLVASLESRLDNAVYRAGFAKTRRLARQLVSHGHFTVDGRRVSIPSYALKIANVFAVREGSRSLPYFVAVKDFTEGVKAPSWISVDLSNQTATVSSAPSTELIEAPADLKAVLEFYSR